MVPPSWAHEERERNSHLFNAIGASEHPFHPQGFGSHITAQPGKHLGKRVKWADLPPDVQTFARQSFPDYAQEKGGHLVKYPGCHKTGRHMWGIEHEGKRLTDYVWLTQAEAKQYAKDNGIHLQPA
ncbi:hypothetical protein D3C84_1064760 [compost metagenome]